MHADRKIVPVEGKERLHEPCLQAQGDGCVSPQVVVLSLGHATEGWKFEESIPHCGLKEREQGAGAGEEEAEDSADGSGGGRGHAGA